MPVLSSLKSLIRTMHGCLGAVTAMPAACAASVFGFVIIAMPQISDQKAAFASMISLFMLAALNHYFAAFRGSTSF